VTARPFAVRADRVWRQPGRAATFAPA